MRWTHTMERDCILTIYYRTTLLGDWHPMHDRLSASQKKLFLFYLCLGCYVSIALEPVMRLSCYN